MTSSNVNVFRVTGHLCGEFTGDFPAQRPVRRSVDVFFDLRLNKRLSKQSWAWWFETLSRPLLRHCNEWIMLEFRLRNYWNLFLMFRLSISQHWFRYWLCADQATSHYLNQWWLVHCRIYASLDLNELTPYEQYFINNNVFINISSNKGVRC